jgi:hypothetical protein
LSPFDHGVRFEPILYHWLRLLKNPITFAPKFQIFALSAQEEGSFAHEKSAKNDADLWPILI